MKDASRGTSKIGNPSMTSPVGVLILPAKTAKFHLCILGTGRNKSLGLIEGRPRKSRPDIGHLNMSGREKHKILVYIKILLYVCMVTPSLRVAMLLIGQTTPTDQSINHKCGVAPVSRLDSQDTVRHRISSRVFLLFVYSLHVVCRETKPAQSWCIFRGRVLSRWVSNLLPLETPKHLLRVRLGLRQLLRNCSQHSTERMERDISLYTHLPVMHIYDQLFIIQTYTRSIVRDSHNIMFTCPWFAY